MVLFMQVFYKLFYYNDVFHIMLKISALVKVSVTDRPHKVVHLMLCGIVS